MANETTKASDESARAEGGRTSLIESQNVSSGLPRMSFVASDMGEAMSFARMMANSNFVPGHLRGKPGDCLAVVMLSGRTGLDMFGLAQKTFFVNDKMAFEAQAVAAMVNASGLLDGRLKVTWSGEGNDLKCLVRGKIKGEDEILEREVEMKTITTRNSPLWKQDPKQQLGYYAQRAWARLHVPEVLMGVYTPEEYESAPKMARATSSISAEMLMDHSRGGEISDDFKASDPEPEEGEGESETMPASDGNPFDDHDPETGEVTSQEDAGPDEGEDQDGDTAEEPMWLGKVRDIREKIAKAKTIKAVEAIEREWVNNVIQGVDDEGLAREVDQQIVQAKRRLTKSEA